MTLQECVFHSIMLDCKENILLKKLLLRKHADICLFEVVALCDWSIYFLIDRLRHINYEYLGTVKILNIGTCMSEQTM